MHKGVVRMDERWYPEREYAAWGDRSGGPLSRAAVRDMSGTGVALDVRRGTPVHLGDPIRVWRRREGAPRHARVVRISRQGCDEGTVTIGCRWIIGEERRRMRSGPATQNNHRVPLRAHERSA